MVLSWGQVYSSINKPGCEQDTYGDGGTDSVKGSLGGSTDLHKLNFKEMQGASQESRISCLDVCRKLVFAWLDQAPYARKQGATCKSGCFIWRLAYISSQKEEPLFGACVWPRI